MFIYQRLFRMGIVVVEDEEVGAWWASLCSFVRPLAFGDVFQAPARPALLHFASSQPAPSPKIEMFVVNLSVIVSAILITLGKLKLN